MRIFDFWMDFCPILPNADRRRERYPSPCLAAHTSNGARTDNQDGAERKQRVKDLMLASFIVMSALGNEHEKSIWSKSRFA